MGPYDDKLDEKITPDFYTRKFQQYSDEKDELTETIKRHSTASTGYLNLGISLYELSQRAREIYLKAKAKDMLKEQKNLMRLVFAKITLDEGKLNWEYSRAFKILSEAVEATNCSKVDKIGDFQNKTFEHRKKPSNSSKKDALYPKHPIWLPNSSIKLYQLFPSDLLEQMRIKLEILHDLLGSKSQYATVEAKNGKFCRFNI